MLRAVSTLLFLSASVCHIHLAKAQTPDSAGLYPHGVPALGPPAAVTGPQREVLVVDIVLVGIIENAARLGFELGELLSAQGIVPRFQQRLTLSENELAAKQKPDDLSRGTVWILFPNSTAARLVFADHAHVRFLIRDIPLPQGMDDVGRESTEQVIESCFLALLQGAAAISRTEMQAAMSPYVNSALVAPPTPVEVLTRPKAPPAVQPRPLPPKPPEPLPSTQSSASTQSRITLTQRLGIAYGANATGGDFGVEHGPELVAGAELIRRHDSLFAAGALDWYFAQHHRNAEFDLRVQTSHLWLIAGWRKPLKNFTSLVVAMGPGIGLTRVTTSGLNGLATSEPGKSYVTPWARVQSGLEWGASPVVIQLLLTAALSFHDTHFEIIRDGVKEQLARGWFLRPGATLGAVWR